MIKCRYVGRGEKIKGFLLRMPLIYLSDIVRACCCDRPIRTLWAIASYSLSLSLKFMIQNLERFFRRIPKFFTFCIVSLQETGKSRQNPEACPVGSLDWMLCKQSITNLTIFQMIKTLAKNASLFRSWHFYQTNFEGFIAKRRRIVKWLLFNYSRVQRFRNTNITLPTIVNAQQKYSW